MLCESRRSLATLKESMNAGFTRRMASNTVMVPVPVTLAVRTGCGHETRTDYWARPIGHICELCGVYGPQNGFLVCDTPSMSSIWPSGA